ncbi:putative lipoprotein [Leptospira wolbachii serovar Codice str. CDC]|uniref:Lipoprotein n=1 Tax=Leptospira wolbachii serovar Codice str. CDC TaxID=1218599 RepID=R9A512_9LEPT|nr:putative lipoprotein [Leptospira wolbachii serovar Codice str. CDC]
METIKNLFFFSLFITALGCGRPNESTMKDNCKEIYGKELPIIVPNVTKNYSAEEFNNFTMSIFLAYSRCLANASTDSYKGPRL